MKRTKVEFVEGTVGGELWFSGRVKVGKKSEEVVLEMSADDVRRLAEALKHTAHTGHAAWHFQMNRPSPCAGCAEVQP